MNNILDLIGNTPLVRIDDILIKCEFFNPTGSSKDRIAYEMLIHERRKIILEATSGNTGVSVAFVCSTLNKKCLIFAPQSTSRHKIKAMKAYGAIVDNKYNDIQESIAAAKAIMGSSTIMRYLNQFHNKYNLQAQIKMAKEARLQYNRAIHNTHFNENYHSPDCIVCGIGTSGTLAGLFHVFPNTKFFTPTPIGFSIEGVCDGVSLPLKPKKCFVIQYGVNPFEVERTKRYLATKKGLWVGDSTAANFLIADKLRMKYKNILIIGHDNGWRYCK